MKNHFQILPDIEIFPSFFPIPKMGELSINSFLIKGREPVLIDTGMAIESDEFMKALASSIDLKDLAWIWITHDDADHIGNLKAVMEAAPKARLAIHALAMLRISTRWQIPMERVYWLKPGESLDLNGRKLRAVRPPLFDNPTTIAVYDETSGVFFSSDCFGALMSFQFSNAAEIPEKELEQGMIIWASADSPWVHIIDPDYYHRSIEELRAMVPRAIFSTHLPPAVGRTEQFLDILAKVPVSAPFTAPGQETLEEILAL
jgi:glyoxylase-like metal-dependent hydrolase (beta-lactamase superfamily II)